MAEITLNGVQFAESKSAALNTLFTSPRTASGWYSVRNGNITLFAMSGERIGGINCRGVLHASTRIDGRWWHSYADPKGIPAWGSYMRKCSEVRSALDSVAQPSGITG